VVSVRQPDHSGRRCLPHSPVRRTALANKVRQAHLRAREDNDRLVERSGSVYRQKVKKHSSTKPPRTAVRVASEMLKLAEEARLLALASETQRELAAQLPGITDRLQQLIGRTTGARRMTKDLAVPLNVYEYELRGGIGRTKEFEKKGLATYAVNVGLACGHACRYCSSPSLRRTHPAFQQLEQTAFTPGIAIVDPATPERLRRRVPELTAKDVVQICTVDDAWSPEARKYSLGRKCLEAVLEETPAQVRILTKSHHVQDDYDLIKRYRERVIVGLSTGTPASRDDVARVIEPNASSVTERLAALRQARKLGLRTFGMLCPVLPGIGDSREALEELFDSVKGAEAIWLEPVNGRGPGLINTANELRLAGFGEEAAAVDHIRKKEDWSWYATELIKRAIQVAESRGVLGILKILLYPKSLQGARRGAEEVQAGHRLVVGGQAGEVAE
jgi:DNA repair photolyase